MDYKFFERFLNDVAQYQYESTIAEATFGGMNANIDSDMSWPLVTVPAVEILQNNLWSLDKTIQQIS